MKIALGSDHRGFSVKQRVVCLLQQLGHHVQDAGTTSADCSVDYPDYAFAVARAVAAGEVERGILVCGSGIGMSIVANKVDGVRAALCHDNITAEMSRRHNNANVLCLASDLLGEDLIDHMVRLWLETDFEGGRHQRRVEKICQIEGGQKA